MRQKGTVIETVDGTNVARVRVLRSAMCDGCENRAEGKTCACSLMVERAKEMIVEAENAAMAVPGDDVEIETESTTVLAYAALVFLVPILGASLAYALGEWLFPLSNLPWAFALGGVLLSFLPAIVVDRKNRKAPPRVRIVSVLGHTAKDGTNPIETR